MFLRRLAGLFASFAFALIGAAAASAQTFFVSPNGSGLSCTQTIPCSIENGTSVGPNSEVVVMPGDYTVTTPLSSLNTANIHGVDGQPRPRITSTTNAAAAWALGSIGMQNMTFRHIEIDTTAQTGIELSGSGTNAVEDVVVTATGANGSGCAPVLTGGGSLTIKNSICQGDATGLGVNCVGCNETVTVRNVTAIGSTNGLRFDSSTGSPSSFTVNAFNVIAHHLGGTGADVEAGAHSTNSSSVINLDHSNYASASAVADCSTAPCTATITTPGTNNNQITPPVFAFELGGDFHEAPGSPTVNAGVNDVSNGSADIDGQNRMIDTTTDIGADELGLPTTTALACSPTALTLPGSSTCTATVTDSTASPVAPTGPVAFESDASGTFSSSTCTLAPSGPTGQASCAVTYTPTVAGTHGLSAFSGQDTTHEGSKGATSLSAAAPATSAPPVTPAVKKKCKKKHKRATAAKKKCKKRKK